MTNELISESTEKQKTEKRAVISISVSAEEKRRISVEALKDYSTTVSDLVRSRMFIKHDQVDGKTEGDEIEVYKDVIQQLKSEVAILNDKNSGLQLQLKENKSEDETPNKEDALVLDFMKDDSGYNIIQKIKDFRSELFTKTKAEELENFYDIEKFTKLIFLRGLKRSYNTGILKEGTGLRISEIEAFAIQEEIDYAEYV